MADTLPTLAATIAARRAADPGSSYVASLFAKGLPKIAQKLGEEAVETVIAALAEDREAVTGEAADLLFHLLVLLEATGVPLAEVEAELARREGISGLDEKAARTAVVAPIPADETIEPGPVLALGRPENSSRAPGRRRIRRG